MASSISTALLLLLLSLSSSPHSYSAALNLRHPQQLPPPPPGVDPGRTSSAVFPLAGNVYPDGIYYVALSIGNPPKPYFLDVDTGSDLTWLQCDAPCVHCSKGPHPLYKPTKNQLLPCKDPICTYLQITGAIDEHGCTAPSDQCDYEIEYADGESSLGVLVSDYFSIHFTNGSLLRPNLAFGCGYDQQGASKSPVSPTDGVLGLGLGKSSVLSQLHDRGLVRSVIGHCLSRRNGGFLFLGDTLIPRSGLTWTPMSSPGMSKYYSPGPANLFYGRQSSVSSNFQVVFDSGSSFTYFSNQHYKALLTVLEKHLNGKPLKEAPEDRTLPYCWKGNKPFRSTADYRRYFSSLVLSFGRKTQFEIPPGNYLITTKHGNACLGILNGTQAGLRDYNVIGDISLQDLLFIYDNERQRIGWARANCERNPNTRIGENAEDGICCQPDSAYMGVLTEEWPSSCYTSTYLTEW